MTSPSQRARACWRDAWHRLPIRLERTALRELRPSDGVSLVPFLQDPDVQRFLPGMPPTVEAFDKLARRWQRHRRCGRSVCLAITVDARAVGLIQAWPLEPSARTAEWGFALGRPYWGQGLFHEAASAFVTLAVSALGVERLEARTPVTAEGGIGALMRLGAHREGLLRQGFDLDGNRVDGVLCTILATDWRARQESDHQLATRLAS